MTTQNTLQIENYTNTDRERAAFKNIPIALLPEVRSHFKSLGIKIVVRYRGSRTNPLDSRYYNQRMQDCVKQFADRFSVYYA